MNTATNLKKVCVWQPIEKEIFINSYMVAGFLYCPNH